MNKHSWRWCRSSEKKHRAAWEPLHLRDIFACPVFVPSASFCCFWTFCRRLYALLHVFVLLLELKSRWYFLQQTQKHELSWEAGTTTDLNAGDHWVRCQLLQFFLLENQDSKQLEQEKSLHTSSPWHEREPTWLVALNFNADKGWLLAVVIDSKRIFQPISRQQPLAPIFFWSCKQSDWQITL